MLQLDRDDRMSLGIFLASQIKNHLGKGATESAELAGLMVGKSDHTIQQWQKEFLTTTKQ